VWLTLFIFCSYTLYFFVKQVTNLPVLRSLYWSSRPPIAVHLAAWASHRYHINRIFPPILVPDAISWILASPDEATHLLRTPLVPRQGLQAHLCKICLLLLYLIQLLLYRIPNHEFDRCHRTGLTHSVLIRISWLVRVGRLDLRYDQ
jgi:hypothetical protein